MNSAVFTWSRWWKKYFYLKVTKVILESQSQFVKY